MSAPEHASQNPNSNYTKNEERETGITNIDKKELFDKRLSHTLFFNNLDIESLVRSVDYETTRPEFLYMRVKRPVKMLYTLLSMHEKRLLREIVEQLIVQLFTKQQVVLGQRSVSLNLNVNVQQVLKDENAERDVNIVKLKRELERLQRELEQALTENVELKRELEKLRKQRDELQRQLQRSSMRVQDKSDKLLEDVVFTLAVVVECIESDCSKQKLLEFIKREYEKLLQHATPPKKEIVNVYVKHMKE